MSSILNVRRSEPAESLVERHSRTDQERGRMRALFVLNSLNIGGSETKTVRVVNALQREGVGAGVAYLNGPDLLRPTIEAGVPVWRLERRGKFSLTALRSLRSIVLQQRPDVVVAMSLYPSLYVLFATRGLAHRPRTVAMINTTDFRKDRQWEPNFYGPLLRRFDSTVYGCELQRGRWRQLLGAAHGRSAVIYNGVDTDHFAPATEAELRYECRRQLGIGGSKFVVGAVGRLAPEKNHIALIDAVAELRHRSLDAHLLLVGEGRMRAELERRIAAHGLGEHVTLAGVQGDVRPALHAMDVFVLPSTHVETFSNAALEAMAMGKPVVLSRIGGAVEMVTDGVEGFTIDCGRLDNDLPPLLAEFCVDAELRTRLGCAARERVTREFSMRAMVDRYRTLIDGQPTGAARWLGRP